MARVPLYQPQVELGRAPIPYQSAEGATQAAFGAQQGAALEATGERLQRISDRLAQVAAEQIQEDIARQAKDAENQLNQRILSIMYGDGTVENPGYYSTQGQGAIDQYSSTRTAIAEARKEIAASLTNPKALQAFSLAADQVIASEYAQMGRKLSQERMVANKTTAEARINTAMDKAMAAYNQPDVLRQSLVVSDIETNNLLDMGGVTNPDARQAALNDARSKIYAGVIEAAATDDAGTARKLYNQYLPAIDGALQPQLERIINQAEKAEEADRERKRVLAERYQAMAQEAKYNDYMTKILASEEDPSIQAPSIKEIAMDPVLKGMQKYQLTQIMQTQDKVEPLTEVSRINSMPLLQNVTNGQITDKSELVTAYTDGKINKADFNWLLGIFYDTRSSDGQRLGDQANRLIEAMRSPILKPNLAGQSTVDDATNFFYFGQYVWAKVKEFKDAKKDPFELFNPGSKEYLATPERIQQFQNSMEQSLQFMMRDLRRGPAVLPAIPGQAPDVPQAETPPVTQPAPKEYSNPNDVKADYKAGLISKEEAIRIIQEKGWQVK